MIEYPKAMPVDALMLMLDKVRGNPVSMAEVVQGAWNISGYGLGLALPLPSVIGAAGDLSDENALEALIQYSQQEVDQVSSAGILPAMAFSIVIKLAIRLLSEYIG
jgi:hypothetical protein